MMSFPNSIEIKPFEKSLKTSVNVPGSKSHSNRAMLLAAVADGVSTLREVLVADDTRTMAAALNQLGFDIDFNEQNKSCTITGLAGSVPNLTASITANDAGTVMRFLTAMLATTNGKYCITGSKRMCERPIADLVDALDAQGAHINCNGCPPLELEANGLAGGVVKINAGTSSQFVSAMLMAAPLARAPLTVELSHDVVSRPFIDLTISIMRNWGILVDDSESCITIDAPQKYKAGVYDIEGDATAASYFWAIAAVTKSEITVSNVGLNSTQGDIAFVDVLQQMGCEVTKTDSSITVRGTGQLRGGRFDLDEIPDTAQTLAVVAAFADTPTEIVNVHNLRQKECDRLSAIATELPKLGVNIEERIDSIKIIPTGSLHGGKIDTYNDHRMAMSFAVAGCVLPNVVINNPACVSKTFPNFFEVLENLRGN